MSATRCPFAAWRPITENIYRGGRQRIRGFVPHVQVGTGSLFGFFNTRKPPGQGASADFWCSKTGVLEQYVDLVDQAWAQGSHEHNGNPFFVSCEFEGQPGEPMTDAQIAAGGLLIAWIRVEVNDFPLQVNTDPNGEGVTPHHVFGGGHTCPGPGPREGQFPLLIAAAQPAAPTPPQEDDVVLYSLLQARKVDKDGHGIDPPQPADPKVWLTDFLTRRHVTDEARLADLRTLNKEPGRRFLADEGVRLVHPDVLADIPIVAG